MSGYNPFALTGKTVLVTGASSGIGRETAIECARLGAKLVITGRNAARLQETFDQLEGEGHRQIFAELTSDDDLRTLAATASALDGVVLCAGVNRPLPVKFCTKDAFAEVFGVNLTAPTELLRLLLAERRIADAGSVVFVSSIASGRGGVAGGNAAYGASKAALLAVMNSCVRECSSRRIRFNAVVPGQVNTPFVASLREKLTPEQIAADLGTYPLGRYGEPRDIAHGIVYLLSDAASWVTGQQLVIDGGRTV